MIPENEVITVPCSGPPPSSFGDLYMLALVQQQCTSVSGHAFAKIARTEAPAHYPYVAIECSHCWLTAVLKQEEVCA